MAQSINLIPQGVDDFGRFMAAAFDDRVGMGVSTGFLSIFGNPMNGSVNYFSDSALSVDIDITRGNERTSSLQPRGTVSRILSDKPSLNEGKYSSFARKFPLAEEEGDINSDQLNLRVAGEPPYNMPSSQQSRLRVLAQRIHLEQIRRMVRMFERLASISSRLGVMPAQGWATTGDYIFDFQRATGNSFSPGTAWDDSSPDIMGDIDTACRAVRQNGKIHPDMAVFGSGMLDAAIKDTTFSDIADNRRFDLIEVSQNFPVPSKYQRYVEAGFVPRGRLQTPEGFQLWVFTYMDYYTDEAGSPQPYMPSDEVLIFSSDARADRYFGPSETLPMIPERAAMYQSLFGINPMAAPMPQNVKNPGQVVMPEMFHCDAYWGQNWKTATIRSQSAPIFSTTMTDGFARIYDGLV